MPAIKLARLLGVIVMFAAITWASLARSPFMQSIPWIPEFIAQWADRNPNFRNFPAFALLSAAIFAATYALKPSHLRPIFLALLCALFATLLAALLETMQLGLPKRSADWRDILHAALGALSGSLISAFLLKLSRS